MKRQIALVCVLIVGGLAACARRDAPESDGKQESKVYVETETAADLTRTEKIIEFEAIIESEATIESEEAKETGEGKAAQDMIEPERQEYAREISLWLTDNRGTLRDVSNHTETENSAVLDMNMDGETELITLQPVGDDDYAYGPLDHYTLSLNNQEAVEGYAENLNDVLLAISLDGREILLALYEDGPSGDPFTRLFRYENGTLADAGSFPADIRECDISEDGVISGIMRMDVIETSLCYVSWKMNEQHVVELIPQEAYTFVKQREKPAILKEELILYTEPGGSESFGIGPQDVEFLQVTADRQWILLETAEGLKGWFRVDDYTIAGTDKNPSEVFDGLIFYD